MNLCHPLASDQSFIEVFICKYSTIILESNNPSLTSQLAANQRAALPMTLSASRYIAPLRIMSSSTTFQTRPSDAWNHHLRPIVDTADDVFPFNKLPPELRVKIWQRTFESRTVVLDAADINIRLPRTPNPIALSVCKESRVETLKYYQVIFVDNSRQYLIYFNPNLDSLTSMTNSIINETIYSQDERIDVQFQSLCFLAKWYPESAKTIQSITISDPYWSTILSGSRRLPFPNLRKLVISPSESVYISHSLSHQNIREVAVQLVKDFVRIGNDDEIADVIIQTPATYRESRMRNCLEVFFEF